MDHTDELQKPTSPPPGTPTKSTFNPDRQVSVLSEEPGSGSEHELERQVNGIISQLDSDSETGRESTFSPVAADEGIPDVPPEVEPAGVEETEMDPVPDFPPPPPPESMTSDINEDDATVPDEEPPPPDALTDEPMENPPAYEPQQTPPIVVYSVVDDADDTEEVDNQRHDDGEPATPGYVQDDEEPDPPEADIEAAGDDPAVINNIHPSGNLPMYRETTKRRYVQHEIVDEGEKERHNSLCWCCMTLFALLSLVALIISVAWIIRLPTDSSESTVDTIEVDGDLISADLRVTLDLQFSDELYDPSSVKYGELEEEFVTSMETIMRETRFRASFFGTAVSGFRSGSTVVYSSLYFVSGAGVSEIRDTLASEIVERAGVASVSISDVEVVEVRVTSEDDIKIPIRVFTTPSTAGRSSTTATGAPPGMTTV